jgi:hypothetical protein
MTNRILRRFPLVIFGAALLIPACQHTPPAHWEVSMHPNPAAKNVEIRVRNASDRGFDQVRVVFPERREVNYGAIPKGGISPFHGVSRAYRYAEFQVKAGDQAFSLVPIDYVGEQELTPGRYTYVLRIQDSNLTVDLEREE